MEVKRPVEPNPETEDRRREPSAVDARRNGYRNTRIEPRHGCVVGKTTAFLERSEPNSTVVGASVDIGNKLVGAMSILLTLFRSNVCWAKPNHAFFYCQHSFAFFFRPTIAVCRIDRRQTPRAAVQMTDQDSLQLSDVCKKALLLSYFFLAAHLRTSVDASTTRQRNRCDGIADRLSDS